MDFEIGQLISGKYRILRRIGVGGMASVYEAQHVGLGSGVAVKVLLPALARVPTVADRFRREARVSATLKSPHVIQVTDVDQLVDGRPYLVMELLHGQSLEQRLIESKSLSRERAVDIGLQILLGLECAHGLGVVHRDLKPGNVFLAQQGNESVAKLLDFGIAKVRASNEFQALTRPGMVMGTPEYMAPEQAFSADQASFKSDLYSVGVMLFEMLSGVLPADGSVPMAVAQQVLTGKVRSLRELRPGLPQGLLNLVHQAMLPDPAARPESALAMRRTLSAFAGELSTAGRLASAVSAEGPREVQLAPGGTEKVSSIPAAGTAQMSHFRPLAEQGNSRPLADKANGHAAEPGNSRGNPQQGSTRKLAAHGRGGNAMNGSPAAELSPALKPAGPAPTAEMPQARGVAATVPTPVRPPAPHGETAGAAPVRRRGRSLLLWLTLCGLLLGAGVGAIWISQLLSDPGPPPPLPRLHGGATAPRPVSPAQRP
ncbi:MAG TPA: protein kinase [Polyangiaceae bacterium]|nr:protein kinase [Polyangiaceae bacterium]